MKSAFQIQLSGYTRANRDASVILTNESTGKTLTRKPFLDGRLVVRDLDPGFYNVEVRHPNLFRPVDLRRVRLFPQPQPTKVNIPVPEDLFVDTPIEDIPDADLGPVQESAKSVADQVGRIGTKSPGEVIRAADFNLLTGAVGDLANALLELTGLVSPHGHDHPEIAVKISEVQDNLRRFAEAYGQSLLELRREIELQNLKGQAESALDEAGAKDEDYADIRGRITDLVSASQSNTAVFTNKLAKFGTIMQTKIAELAERSDDPVQYMQKPVVKELQASAQQYSLAGTLVQPEAELRTYQRTTTTSGGRKFSNIFSQTVNKL